MAADLGWKSVEFQIETLSPGIIVAPRRAQTRSELLARPVAHHPNTAARSRCQGRRAQRDGEANP
jgi:hypothetical protein